MGMRGKKLSPKKFGIKFGSYFPKFYEDGNVQKAKNGRVISIFVGNDTTNSDGHLYTFPSLSETRELVFRKMARITDASYWEGSALKWEAHPNSAIWPKGGTAAPHVDMDINEAGDVVIPMRKKKPEF
jgi:hypothetical protein